MSEDHNTLRYLALVANTISVIIFWMITNLFFGIYLNYGFPEGNVSLANIIYYILAIASLVWLVRYLVKKWRVYNQQH